MNKTHLLYLDDLKRKGVINIFSAVNLLKLRFNLCAAEARTVLVFWMRTKA